MDYQIDGVSGFESLKVVIRSSGLFSWPKLLIDNEIVKDSWGKYTLRRTDGQEVMARVISNFIDPIPLLIVDGQTYTPIPPLLWYQLVYIVAPIILLAFIGHVPGILFGLLVASFNVRIFRSNMQPVKKYVFTGAISCTAILTYLILILVALLTLAGDA